MATVPFLGGSLGSDSACRLNAFTQFDSRGACSKISNAARYHIARLVLGNVFIQPAGNHLLNAQPQTPSFAVNLKHLGFDQLSDLQHVARMVNTFFSAEVAYMNHTFHAFSKLHE